jgi:hypothetical protein
MKNSRQLNVSKRLTTTPVVATSLVVAAATLVVTSLLLVACGAASPPAATVAPLEGAQAPTTSADSGIPAAPEGYPPPTAAPETTAAYPPGEAPPPPEPTLEPGSYPPSQAGEAFQEPRFRFDQPLAANATTVTGQAPPDVALAIADITFNGAILGSGRSDADGRFSISVSPLPAGHRIGVTVAVLQPGQTISDMSAQYYPHRGDGFMNLPNIGVFFETALVGS